MTDSAPQLTYTVTAHRIDVHGSTAQCKEATLILDTDLAGRLDAFNPAELLLAAVAACMLKSIERLAPMLQFTLRGVSVSLTGESRTSRRGSNRSPTRFASTPRSQTSGSHCCTRTCASTGRSPTPCHRAQRWTPR